MYYFMITYTPDKFFRKKLRSMDTPQALNLKNHDFQDLRIPRIEAVPIMRDAADAPEYFLLNSKEVTPDLLQLTIMSPVSPIKPL